MNSQPAEGYPDIDAQEPLSDQELLETIRLGEAALRAFLSRHGETVQNVASGHLDQPADVANAALTATARIVRALRINGTLEFDGPDGASRWVAGVTRNTSVGLHSSRSEDTSDMGRRLQDASPVPDALPDFRRDPRVHAAMATLSLPERQILLLRHFEGLTNRQIARQLGIPETTASNRYSRALTTLRMSLG
jgi:RNA polymerase sigma factor (sigma-70 family)